MKNLKLSLIIFLSVILCLNVTSCKSDDDDDNKPVVVTGNCSYITFKSAAINGMLVSGDVKECGFYFGTSSNPKEQIAVVEEGGHAKIEFTLEMKRNLLPNTKYYYKAYCIDNKNRIITGEVKSFTTGSTPELTINSLKLTKSGDIVHIATYTLAGKATVNPKGCDILSAGFIYSPNINPPIVLDQANDIKCSLSGNTFSFQQEISFNYIFSDATHVVAYVVLPDGLIVSSNPVTVDAE